jgi:drug/metabolite transporter (DMT)-like permease
VHLQHFVNRRTQELYSTTRSEILTSIGAALFFVAVIWWRLPPSPDRLQQIGLAIVIAWVLFTLYRFRDRIWRRPRIDAVAASGLDYYCTEMKKRQDHLRNEWIWHGPLFLACMISILSFAVRSSSSVVRLRNAMPIVIFLVIWIVVGLVRRRRLANDLQREIDEMQA